MVLLCFDTYITTEPSEPERTRGEGSSQGDRRYAPAVRARETPSFFFFFWGGVVFILTSGPVCQDRLGINEGKVEAKRRVFPQGFRRRSRGRRAVRVSCCYSSSFAIQMFGPTLLRNCRVFVLSRAFLCKKWVCLKLSRETSGDH